MDLLLAVIVISLVNAVTVCAIAYWHIKTVRLLSVFTVSRDPHDVRHLVDIIEKEAKKTEKIIVKEEELMPHQFSAETLSQIKV